MKKMRMILLLLIACFCVATFGQANDKVDNIYSDSVCVVKCVDTINNVTFLGSNRNLVMNENKPFGFMLSVYFMTDGVPVISSNMFWEAGNKNQLVIQLENGETISMISWKEASRKPIKFANKMNNKMFKLMPVFDGSGYFTITKDIILKLKRSPISKINVKDSTFPGTYMINIDDKNKHYFIQLFKSYDSGKFEIVYN